MQGGDISNETSPRIIVIVDVVLGSDVEVTNRVFLPSVTERKVKLTKNLALSQLWNMANKYGLSVELAAFESELWTQKQLDDVMNKLDRRGANPFNYAELYNDIEDFIGELPYRSNLKGVIDIRERVARYGSYGIELENL